MRDFTGSVVQYELFQATPGASLAGMQPKVGVRHVEGSGPIQAICLLVDGRPGVVVGYPLGSKPSADVALDHLRTVDEAPVTPEIRAELEAWFYDMIGAWIVRHGGTDPGGRQARLDALTRMKGEPG